MGRYARSASRSSFPHPLFGVRSISLYALVAAPTLAAAQTLPRHSLAVGADAIGVVTRVSPAFVGRNVTEVSRPSLFEPAQFHGSTTRWHLSAGVRVGAGMRHARMGRYGFAAP